MTKMTPNQFYCVSCRKRIRLDTDHISVEYDKRGRPRLTGHCKTCGTRVFKYIKLSDVDKFKKRYGEEC